jgi:hypothetical protein
MKFSQRAGITPVRVEIQRESIDTVLLNKLWSAVHLVVFEPISRNESYIPDNDNGFAAKRLWLHHYEQPIDRMPSDWPSFSKYVRDSFFAAAWYEVYDLLEQVADEFKEQGTELRKLVNSFLESEMSAYRFVDTYILAITSAEEIDAIEAAASSPDVVAPAKTHLRTALAMLTDRQTPDHRNAVKEAILAVEAMCQHLTGDTNASLGKAIKRLRENGVRIPPVIEVAWSKLYGWSSNEGGIRHALSGEETIGFAEAKYMLVSCSAFVNYLVDSSRTSAGVS